ncbi:hypothetical protein SAMN04488543_2822 [Friedmanniella luteola]|uniref:Uncharacterized protein n=1 Tax=Friedmanniella luteola TaxID=546871 RepID=A0A1H1WRI7_9ACTN|nr:hypothetical protein [Friedmanniella luteola]SDS98956.1 hypothetical protein SAMN04488543_2790 [Friedmanniella luteola]SDT00538.1 hypothetical protein SAMN04488543_2822 [Friedmanniella luteola]
MSSTTTARRWATPRPATLFRAAIALVAALAVALALVMLGKPEITKTRVENSLNPAFSNLYIQQQQILGHPGISPASMKTTSTCDRGGANVPDVGAGPDWLCLVNFVDSTGTLQEEAKFELQVHANSCYTAGAPAKLLGSFTITDTNGREVPNPVNAFDVCFDPDA